MQPGNSYSNLRQGEGETSYAGYHPMSDQVPGPTTNFSPHLSGANANQRASPEWRFHDCWVSHVEETEIHLTIALKRVPAT